MCHLSPPPSYMYKNRTSGCNPCINKRSVVDVETRKQLRTMGLRKTEQGAWHLAWAGKGGSVAFRTYTSTLNFKSSYLNEFNDLNNFPTSFRRLNLCSFRITIIHAYLISSHGASHFQVTMSENKLKCTTVPYRCKVHFGTCTMMIYMLLHFKVCVTVRSGRVVKNLTI